MDIERRAAPSSLSPRTEIADVLEQRGAAYAALDLDWLAWFDTQRADGPSEHDMMLANLQPMIENYRREDIRHFVLARSLESAAELRGLSERLSMRLRVIRLHVPLPEIERRLRADVTRGRRDDLREAAAWIAGSKGVGIENLTVDNEGPIRGVALKIVDWLGWSAPWGRRR
jgi:hypothetical protein